jgi:hypothetical protein
LKARGAAIQGALALGALAAAYVTWQRPKEARNAEEMVLVLETSKASLQKVRYEDGEKWMELSKEADQTWLTLGSFPSKVQVQPTTDDAGTVAIDGGVGSVAVKLAPAEPPGPPKQLKGNERAEKVWEKFIPLEALRSLGKLSAEKEKELGFEEATRVLTLTVSGNPRAYRVSNPSIGMVGTYLRDEKDGTIYLEGGGFLQDLDPNGQTLVDRRLHTFKAADFDELVLTVNGKSKAYVQRDADIPQTTKIAPKDNPQQLDELMRNWHEKIWSRLVVTEVLSKGEAPKTGEPTPAFRIEYLAKGQPKGFLEIARTGNQVWAKSENTASWVGLHVGTDDLVAEATKFVTSP